MSNNLANLSTILKKIVKQMIMEKLMSKLMGYKKKKAELKWKFISVSVRVYMKKIKNSNK